MRKIAGAAAVAVIALSLASCQWMSEMRLEEAQPTLAPAETQVPGSQAPDPTEALPSGVVVPDESDAPVFSPSIEIPPPLD